MAEGSSFHGGQSHPGGGQLDELKALNKLNTALSSSLSFSDVGKAGLQGIAGLLPTDVVFMFEIQGKALELTAVYPESKRASLKGFENHLLGGCLCGIAAGTLRPVYSKDIHQDSRCISPVCKVAGFKSIAVLPLHRGGSLMCVLGMASSSQYYFEGKKALIENIAGQMSLNLANARHFEAAQSELEARKRAESELLLFKESVECSSDAVGISTAEGRHIYQNRAFDELFGDIGSNPVDVYVDASIAKEVFNKIMEGGRWEGELEMYGRGREVKSVYLRAYANKGPNGAISSLVGVHTDLTHRQKARAALARSEDRFKNIVNASPMGVHMYQLIPGQGLVFTGANPAAASILGVDHEQFIGKTIEEAFPPLAQTDVPNRYKAAAEFGEEWRTEQIDYDDAGIRGAYEVVAFQTSPGRMAAFFHDITERKKAQEDVAHERERLAVTLKSIGDGVITTCTQGRVVLMNIVAEELCGWSQEEARGRPLAEVFNIINEFTREPCENPVDKVFSTRGIIELANHTVLISRGGTERIIADSGAPIISIQGEVIGVVLVFRDMTEKTKLLEAAQNNQKLESLGVLAGGIAHDFNNLLGGIFGSIDLALDEVKGTQAGQYLEDVMKVMERARALTQQLLTFSKGGAPVKKNAPLFPFVEESARFALSGSNISCSVEVPPNLHLCSYDRNQLGQVIDNIVINAQQAMPRGGNISIKADNQELTGSGHLPGGQYVCLSIKDQGIGIPRNILANIFDPFFTTKSKGHGLGLATCHSIITRHGGDIRVQSEPGQGTEFKILLPAAQGKAEGDDHVPAQAQAGGGRVLIMDDVPVLRSVVKKMLENSGYLVTCTENGTEAVKAFQQAWEMRDPFVAVIFDLTIPGGMGGSEAVSHIRKIDKNVPVIVSSGYAQDPIMAHPTEFGFTTSISKPFTKNAILELLAKHIK